MGAEAGSPAAPQENEPALFNPATIREFTPTFDITPAVRVRSPSIILLITHSDRRRQMVHLKTGESLSTPSPCHP